ncbi:unnamed protein product [Arabidopsis halleri]
MDQTIKMGMIRISETFDTKYHVTWHGVIGRGKQRKKKKKISFPDSSLLSSNGESPILLLLFLGHRRRFSFGRAKRRSHSGAHDPRGGLANVLRVSDQLGEQKSLETSESPPPPCTDFDVAYFHSYAHVGIHEEMIKFKPKTCEVQAHKGDTIKVHYRATICSRYKVLSACFVGI